MGFAVGAATGVSDGLLLNDGKILGARDEGLFGRRLGEAVCCFVGLSLGDWLAWLFGNADGVLVGREIGDPLGD